MALSLPLFTEPSPRSRRVKSCRCAPPSPLPAWERNRAPFGAYHGEVRIEQAQETDLNAVVSLLAEQFREHRIDLNREQLSEAVLGLLSQPSRGAILLARDPEPVGVAVLAFTWTLEHGGLVAWLDELFVLPEHRGSGIGRALLRRALELAKEHGCRAVDLEVDGDHARAERLYQREGFSTLHRRRWAKKLI